MPTTAGSAPIDVVVIGGGPAGAAAARLLASWNHSVVLLGRAAGRRPMAESLPPSCTKLFDRLAVRNVIDAAGFVRATGNTVQWAGSDRRVESFDAGATGYQVSRDAFDAVMVDSAAAGGATVYSDATARDVAPADHSEWRVTFDFPSGRAEVRARWVLDCTGRSGLIARRGWRRASPAARTMAVVGIWEPARGEAWRVADDTHTLVESYEGGWAWSVPVSRTRRYITVMLDPTLTELPGRARLDEAYRAELARTSMLRALISGGRLVDAPWGSDASPYFAERFVGDGMMLVGDAASFVDPLSSFGVKKALASAWLAAVAVHTAITERHMTGPAMELFTSRERAMYEQLQRQSAALSREAAGAHESDFWLVRADAIADESTGDMDFAALRADRRVLVAFEELKRRPSVHLRASESLRVVDRPAVRGNRVVLEHQLVGPNMPNGVRYCRNVDLFLIAQLAAHHQQVPDLFDAYNRAAPPAPLPDFLGAVSTLVGLEMLCFA